MTKLFCHPDFTLACVYAGISCKALLGGAGCMDAGLYFVAAMVMFSAALRHAGCGVTVAVRKGDAEGGLGPSHLES